jgi:hypothetical protein
MRASARALAAVFAWAVVAVLGGCSTAGVARPDAEVARRVELEEQKRLSTVVLASADEELPVALPGAGGVAAAPAAVPVQPVATVPGAGSADRYFSITPDEWPRSFSIGFDGDGSDRNSVESLAADPGERRGGGEASGGGKPRIRFNLFRFTIAGRPVSLRCSLKNKHLMFGAKIIL